jgi:polar amino acid transport system permease protein
VAAVVIVILVVLFVYGAATNDAYRWQVFGEYLFNERIFLGVTNTLQLTIYSMVLAIVLGVILAVMRLSANPVFRSVSWVYLWIFRGTPIYVQLTFWGLIPTIYKNIQLGVPFGPSLFHLDLQSLSIPFLLATLGLALNEAAYMAEIIRAGISSVPEGQLEASTALGMSWGLAMRRTVLPQAMRVIIPPTGNEVISMLKTTSLVTAVPYTLDLYSIATREIAAREFEPVPLLLVAAAWYLAVTSVLMVGQFYLERYYSRGASRKLTTKQLEALAKAQTAQLGEPHV